MKRILAIDFGLKRIGLALSDSSQKIALPLKTIEIQNPNQDVSLVLKAIQDRLTDIETVVLGNPLLLSGKKGEMADNVQTFKEKLEKKLNNPLISVVLWDERLTSAQADKMLKKDYNRKKRSQIIDPVAATIILQNYLDSKSFLNNK